MSQEEWQDTLSDAAKTDDNDPPREIDVYLVIQFILLQRCLRKKFTAASAAGKCDRNREVPPRAAPIDRARDNSLPPAEPGMPTRGPRVAPAPAAATETRER